jgi:hypothetical protein
MNKAFTLTLVEFLIIVAIIAIVVAIFLTNKVTTQVIDGCEYITTYSGRHSMTHKGNCTNEIHRKRY